MINQEIVMQKLRTVLDPELGINIVDLGLVYAVYLDGSTISVDLTLTTPGCPLIAEFINNASSALKSIEGVGDVIVNLVFEPLWTPDKMSDEAKEELGFI
jgi:metal-sulfur cluster biosynthetic enzyme